MFTLTRGSLKKILESTSVTDPIMQIIQMKQIQNNMDGVTRYKVTLFDGETQHTFGILATQKNHLVENGELKIGSVIKLEEYAANVLSKDPPKVVIILLNFEVLGEMDPDVKPNLSAPVATSVSNGSVNENMEPKKEFKPAATSGMKGDNYNGSSASAKNFFNKDASLAKSVINASSNNASSSGANNNMFNNQKIFGISSLNPYQNKWSIKVRVTNKSAIRTYTNAKGEGKVFSVDFIDNTGEIKANGFNEQCDKFYDMLQLDHVYYVSRATLKTANKQYSKLDNDYEMTFGHETMIEPCNESADNIPHMNLNVIKIADIQHKAANEFVDIMAVVKSAGDVTTIVTKQTNKELKKRELTLVDDSNHSITATLWGKQAEDFEPSDGLVILLKGAKVGDYNGKNLSVATTTQVQLNPDVEESFKLRSWFDNGGADSEMTELSSMAGSGSQSMGGGAGGQMGAGSASSNNWKYLDQMREERLGMNDKADYFTSKSYVLYARKDNSMYMACPGENCNKKVIDQNDGTFRCEKCAKNYTEFRWRVILSLNIADFSDNTWVTSFQESAEAILGHSAEDLGRMKDENATAYDEVFTNCVFQEFNFRLRAKMETYNDEKRVKVSVVSVEPMDYAASGRRLLNRIKEFAKSQI